MIRAPATWSPAAVSVLVTLCLASAACSNAENNDPDVGAVVASDGIAVDGSALDAPDLQGDLPDAQADTQTGELDVGTDDVATDTVAASDAADEPNDGTADDSTDAEIADTAPDASPKSRGWAGVGRGRSGAAICGSSDCAGGATGGCG